MALTGTGVVRHDMQSERREEPESWGTEELKGHLNPSCEPPHFLPPHPTGSITLVPPRASCLVLAEQK